MKLTKKTVTYIIIGVASAFLLTVGTVLILSLFNKEPEPTIESANAVKSQGTNAFIDKDYENAKRLLEKAVADYEAVGDTSSDDYIDAKSLLFQIENK